MARVFRALWIICLLLAAGILVAAETFSSPTYASFSTSVEGVAVVFAALAVIFLIADVGFSTRR